MRLGPVHTVRIPSVGSPTFNLPVPGAVLSTFGLQLAVIYTPFLQPVFKTRAPSLAELVLCVASSALVLPAIEPEKWLIRRGCLYGEPAE